MVNEECSITSFYFFLWNHYIFNLDSFICIPSTEAYSVYVFPHVEGVTICGGLLAFFCAFIALDCAHVGLPWFFIYRQEWNETSIFLHIYPFFLLFFVLLKSRPLMPWTIQHLGWTKEIISLLFSLTFCGFCILSTLLQKILCQCSQD